MEKIIKTEEEWKKILTAEQYHVMREKGTERPFTCEMNEYKGEGIFACAACGLPLFHSGKKFNSGTGWPSFTSPVDEDNLVLQEDPDYGLRRIEVLCARCDSHLGHVFDDLPAGKQLAGKRYCMNGVALEFLPSQSL